MRLSMRNSRAREINVQSHVELPPGDYGLRVAVTGPGNGEGGKCIL